MSLREISKKYYTENGKNCAEAILLAGNEFYSLNLCDNASKLLVGFGGGMGCGKICGCLAGSISVLGCLFSTKPEFREICAEFTNEFIKELGCESIDCSAIGPKYKTAERKCEEVVLVSADLLEKFIAKKK